MGGPVSIDLRSKHDLESRRRTVELFDAGVPAASRRPNPVRPRETERMAVGIPGVRKRGAAVHGRKQSSYTHSGQGRRGVGRGRRRDGEGRRHGRVRDQVEIPLERWCRLYREGSAEALQPRPKGRPRVEVRGRPAPAGGGSRSAAAGRGRGRLHKIARPGRAGRSSDRGGGQAVRALRAEGHSLRLLGARGSRRSTYYYALAHPRRADPARAARRTAEYSRAPPTAAGTGE